MKLQSVDDPGLNKGGGSDVLLSNDLLLDNSDGGARRLLHLGGLGHRGHQVVQLLPVLLQRVPSLHSSSTDLASILPNIAVCCHVVLQELDLCKPVATHRADMLLLLVCVMCLHV